MSLLSALETRKPAPSARVLPSQGWAPAPAPPGSAPGGSGATEATGAHRSDSDRAGIFVLVTTIR